MNINEETLSSKIAYEGRIITVRNDEVKLPNGRIAKRDVIEHPGGVGIIAVDDNENIYLVTQYRTGVKQVLTEIPAGKLERGENPLECGKRELREEVGMVSDDFTDLGYFIPTPAYCEEITYLYMARNLKKAEQDLDDDEFLNITKMPLAEAKQKVIDGTFTDGKTAIAILKACAILNK